MSGTKIGGLKAREKNLQRDPDWYRKIGATGGKASNTGGFAYSAMNGLDLHIEAGRKGGTASRRTGTSNKPAPVKHWYDFLRRKHD